MPTCRHHRPGHRKVGRKRFPNKSIKVKERAYKQVRQLEENLTEAPMPSIILDLGVDKVSDLIRSATGDNEDAFQDTWEAILGDHVGSEEDILRIAREIRHKHNAEVIAKEYKEVSLDEPIGEHRDEGNFTLKDILAAEPVSIDSPSRVDRHEKPQSVSLDRDTQAALKQKFPNLSYRDAVRQLAGLCPAIKQNPLWQPSEDDIIRTQYAWGGSLAVSVNLDNRTPDAIRCRARQLGVKFDRFRPNGEWLTTREVSGILGFNRHHVYELASSGKLQSIPVKHLSNKPSYFFPLDSIEHFLKREVWLYDVEKVSNQYQQYIPNERCAWISLKKASDLAKCGYQTILRYVRLGLVQTQTAYRECGFHRLVRVQDVELAGKHFKERRRAKHPPRPYKTVMRHDVNHCVIQDDDGDWHWRCKGIHNRPFCLNAKARRQLNQQYSGLHLRPPQFTRGKPTCKVCLAIWNRERYQP